MARINGLIARLADDRYGYGFISPVDGGKDVFFHNNELKDMSFNNLREGDCVNFDVEAGPKGPAAVNIFRDFVASDHPAPARLSGNMIELSPPSVRQEARIVKSIDIKMIQFFKENPQALREIDPRFFEELYAEFMKQDGYAVNLLGSCNTPDGGVDLIGVKKIGDVQFKTVVQCKHSKNRVSADPVRALNGVLDRFSAHAGIVATTSYFTKPAIEETRQNYYRISLEDYESIKRQLIRLRTG